MLYLIESSINKLSKRDSQNLGLYTCKVFDTKTGKTIEMFYKDAIDKDVFGIFYNNTIQNFIFCECGKNLIRLLSVLDKIEREKLSYKRYNDLCDYSDKKYQVGCKVCKNPSCTHEFFCSINDNTRTLLARMNISSMIGTDKDSIFYATAYGDVNIYDILFSFFTNCQIINKDIDELVFFFVDINMRTEKYLYKVKITHKLRMFFTKILILGVR